MIIVRHVLIAARFIGQPTLMSEAVPTGVAVGPDANYYVAKLTGFPFSEGAGSYCASPQIRAGDLGDDDSKVGALDSGAAVVGGHLRLKECGTDGFELQEGRNLVAASV